MKEGRKPKLGPEPPGGPGGPGGPGADPVANKDVAPAVSPGGPGGPGGPGESNFFDTSTMEEADDGFGTGAKALCPYGMEAYCPTGMWSP